MTRTEVLRRRFAAQGLHRGADALAPRADWWASVPVLDLGVQDTGPDGAAWALALRGAPLGARTSTPELALAWTVRGAPHVYRRAELPDVARALVPLSESDARKRVADASKPLREAGIDVTDALVEIGRHMRRIVTAPTVKGEMSTRLTAAVSEPYLRWCTACRATHLYELPFRLAALHAGLELEPGTSPPVLGRVPSWPAGHLDRFAETVRTPPAERGVPDHLDLVRAYLRLLGPARPADVAAYLDAPAADVRRRWAELGDELVEVDVEGERRWAAADADTDADGGGSSGVVRLLGPFDLLLQAKDRELLVPNQAARKELWPVLGRPGAVVLDGEVVGTWRPRASGGRLRVEVRAWAPWTPAVEQAVDTEAERLAAFRGVTYAGRAS
ncbi:AlkZ family DNA glycosylase [Actinotalea ferrariae]|uniref:winged helix DNA-binding domain-containing protein n=1 Tax=Actinotalea ferrariae TaxID=1386098 RepID=UPI001C8C7D0F|nr:winged helix DNA-binding domain-containing protein [Actinotalea ferrariae]MBX9247063.1 AlkZ family DNA glycosylase [Actinotalea ferrariae]